MGLGLFFSDLKVSPNAQGARMGCRSSSLMAGYWMPEHPFRSRAGLAPLAIGGATAGLGPRDLMSRLVWGEGSGVH